MSASMDEKSTRKRRNDFHIQEDSNERHRDSRQNPTRTRHKTDGRIVWIIICCFYLAIYAFVRYRMVTFPEPKSPVPGSDKTSFYETNARVHLKQFSMHGPRIVGSEANEIFAYNYILKEVKSTQRNALPNKNIEIDEQNVTGAFDIEFLSDFVSVYRNIKNIVVKLNSETGSKHSLLMSCHYDSAVDSPGAGDNAISCAVMMEVLRIFSQSPQKQQHSIIFLFNGAEENLLQASHGFITSHKWAESIQAFVNIDSAGAGGWEVVFQTGPYHPWLVRAYAESSPYPCGSIFGQEMFQSGLIPSDTDYRIYRDFGEIPGLDIAYISNGYVYHTPHDQNKFIQPGCVQRGGENLLALLRKLSSSAHLADPGLEKHGMMVFFDVVGYVMIYYPQSVATIVNSALVAAVLFKVIRKTFNLEKSENHDVKYFRNLTRAMFYIALTWIVVFAICIAMAMVVTVLGRNMSWFTHTYNIVPLFILPSCIAVCVLHDFLNKTTFRANSPGYNEQIFFEATMCVWSLMTLLLTIRGLGSAFFPMLYVLFPLFVRDRTAWVCKAISWTNRPYLFLSLHLLSLLLPTLISMYVIGYATLSLFIPIMGRIGAELNSDLAIGGLVAIIIVLSSCYMVSLCYICSNMKKVITFLSVITIAWLLAIVFTPIGFPYSGDPDQPTPMRLLALHVHRRTHNLEGKMTFEDSGIWLLPFDYNNNKLLQEVMPSMKEATNIDCSLGPYCGVPYLIPVLPIIHAKSSYYMPTDSHHKPFVSVNLVNTQVDGTGLIKMSFQVTGPDHMSMQVRPHAGVSLERWSLTHMVPEPAAMPPDMNETTYFVYYSHGETPVTPWSFSMHFKVPQGHPARDIVDIGFAGHYLHGDKRTKQMDEFLHQTPDWLTPVTWPATWDGYVF